MNETWSWRLIQLKRRRLRLIKALLNSVASRPGNTPPQTVFIGGIPRSGTNMVMDVLDQSYETDVFHESDPRVYSGTAVKNIEILLRYWAGTRAPVIVFKAILDSHNIPQWMDLCPPAKCVWIVRNCDDTCRSHVRSFLTTKERLGRAIHGKEAGPWMLGNLSPSVLKVAQHHYTPDMSAESAAALLWYLRHELYFELGLHKSEDTRILYYDEFVQNPNKGMASLCSFLSINAKPRMSRDIHAKSMNTRRLDAIDPAIRKLCEEVWIRVRDQGRFI